MAPKLPMAIVLMVLMVPALGRGPVGARTPTGAESHSTRTPGESAVGPDESAVAAGESALAPDESAVAPVDPSNAAGESANAPGESANAPGKSAVAPVDPSNAAGESTLAAGESALAQVDPSNAAGESALAPDESALAPVDPSNAAGESTLAAGESALAPGESAVAPVDPSNAAGESALAQVDPSDVAIESALAPGESANAADELALAQVEPALAQVDPSVAPGESAVAPVDPSGGGAMGAAGGESAGGGGAVAVAGVRVSLLTIGQGDAVWEKFGHNMVRVQLPYSGVDQAYNWGVFSFEQENFVLRFLRGRMLYSMAVAQTDRFMAEYFELDRQIAEQRLELSSGQTRRLFAYLDDASRPENREYRYDYFRDNCSTRVRDALDAALGGQLRQQLEVRPAGYTMRDHTMRLLGRDWWYSVGIDFTLGRLVDRPINQWQEAFLPGKLEEAVAGLRVRDEAGGEPRALVGRSQLRVSRTRPPTPQVPPARGMQVLGIGLAGLGAVSLLLWTGRGAARKAATLVCVGWCVLAGVAGVFLTGMWVLTDHEATHRNENLIVYSPLALLLAVGLARLGRRRCRTRARAIAAALVAITLLSPAVKLLPGAPQQNWGWIGLGLCMYLACGLRVWYGGPMKVEEDGGVGIVNRSATSMGRAAG